jgi:hypothetical protein
MMWWEPEAVSVTHRDTEHSLIHIFYRIRIERMTGHRSSPDPTEGERLDEPKSKLGTGGRTFLISSTYTRISTAKVGRPEGASTNTVRHSLVLFITANYMKS